MPMTAQTAFNRLVVATRNAHKLAEIRAMLGPKLQYLSLTDFPQAPAAAEDAPTFAGNATRKAVELARWLAVEISNLKSQISNPTWVLADDSGLEVDALHGAPGVFSARFAAMDSGKTANSSDADNNAKLLRLLKDTPSDRRTARFRCVLALTPVHAPAPRNASPVCYADEFEMQTELFEGTCEGQIELAPRGQRGFGYDPLFVPNGCRQTFAELGEDVKNRLSHRAKALEKLKRRLAPQPSPRS